jgi:predicted nuclease with TOPRIM domain
MTGRMENMTTQEVNDRVLKLKQEQLALSEAYDAMNARMQQMRNRFQQIEGAILLLNEMKNGEKP